MCTNTGWCDSRKEDIYQRATDLMTNQHRHPSLADVIRDSLPLRPIRNTEHDQRFSEDHMTWLTLTLFDPRHNYISHAGFIWSMPLNLPNFKLIHTILIADTNFICLANLASWNMTHSSTCCASLIESSPCPPLGVEGLMRCEVLITASVLGTLISV